jgi:antitoxin YefM
MKLSISNDIIPIGKFKVNISKWIKSIQKTRHPLIITQNGKPAGVLLSPAEYDELTYKQSFVQSINRGINDAENEHTYSTNEVRDELKKRRG